MIKLYTQQIYIDHEFPVIKFIDWVENIRVEVYRELKNNVDFIEFCKPYTVPGELCFYSYYKDMPYNLWFHGSVVAINKILKITGCAEVREKNQSMNQSKVSKSYDS